MTTDKKLLERIQKLMALADPTKNASQAQVEAAMEKVAELLTKHNLTPENITIHELKSQLMYQSSHVRWQHAGCNRAGYRLSYAQVRER